jgi:hypothetical protein
MLKPVTKLGSSATRQSCEKPKMTHIMNRLVKAIKAKTDYSYGALSVSYQPADNMTVVYVSGDATVSVCHTTSVVYLHRCRWRKHERNAPFRIFYISVINTIFSLTKQPNQGVLKVEDGIIVCDGYIWRGDKYLNLAN